MKLPFRRHLHSHKIFCFKNIMFLFTILVGFFQLLNVFIAIDSGVFGKYQRSQFLNEKLIEFKLSNYNFFFNLFHNFQTDYEDFDEGFDYLNSIPPDPPEYITLKEKTKIAFDTGLAMWRTTACVLKTIRKINVENVLKTNQKFWFPKNIPYLNFEDITRSLSCCCGMRAAQNQNGYKNVTRLQSCCRMQAAQNWNSFENVTRLQSCCCFENATKVSKLANLSDNSEFENPSHNLEKLAKSSNRFGENVSAFSNCFQFNAWKKENKNKNKNENENENKNENVNENELSSSFEKKSIRLELRRVNDALQKINNDENENDNNVNVNENENASENDNNINNINNISNNNNMNEIKNIELFIGIVSLPQNFKLRMAIRNTWINIKEVKTGIYRYRFFIALHDEVEVNVRVIEERMRYDDIELLFFIENYELISLKTLCVFHYASKVLSAPYILKSDDDSFVRIRAIMKKVRRMHKAQKDHPKDQKDHPKDQKDHQKDHQKDRKDQKKALLYGYLEAGFIPNRNWSQSQKPSRNQNEKWIASKEEWPRIYYNHIWARGCAYLISHHIADYVVFRYEKDSLQMKRFEDVLVGLWVDDFKNDNAYHHQQHHPSPSPPYHHNHRHHHEVQFVHDDDFGIEGCKQDFMVAHYQNSKSMACLWHNLVENGNASCCQ